MTRSEPKAIIFDCFGVLASDGWLPFKNQHFGRSPTLLQQATNLNKQVDAGLLDYEMFKQTISDMANVPLASVTEAIDNNLADTKLFAYIQDYLKPHYKLGMLSNAGANWLDDMFTLQQINLFDAVALSYETGVLKPDARAYQIIANRLGVEPADCIFIDDQERYCSAARDEGMQAIVYQDFDQMLLELEPLLHASGNPEN